MNMALILKQLAGGMVVSIEIFAATLIFSLPLGLIVSFGRMSRIKPVQWITKLYLSLIHI